MDYTTQINLYRITQEALQNIRKHSRASRVTVRLISSSPRIILRIKDNGRGFNPAQARTKKSVGGNHLGLTSIEERTRLLSGEFSISSREGEGTEIKVNVPLNERDILL
jgi:signal transduction histidine kinase